MKVLFAGTPEFAAQALEAILAAGFEVPLVLTQPDRPSGRGMKLTASAVKAVAMTHGIAVAQPTSLKLNGAHADAALATRALLTQAQADVMVVAAYGLILPGDILNIPKHGCVNIHASLLPRWRGAAPIHRAIEAGDEHTGITLMQMDEGLDTGGMLSVTRIPILPSHSTGLLHDELTELGARMVVRYLQQLEQGTAPTAIEQPLEGVTYAEKIKKTESALDWRNPAEQLERKVRALNPAPACTTVWQGHTLKVWAAELENSGRESTQVIQTPGTIVHCDAAGVQVACGSGILRLTQLQVSGGKRLPATQVAQSLRMESGSTMHISGTV